MSFHVDPQFLVENAPVHLLLIDDEFKIRYVNHVVPGLDKEALIGASSFDGLNPVDAVGLKAMYQRVFDSGTVEAMDVEPVTQGQEIGCFTVRAARVEIDGRRFLAISSHYIDERKRLENELNSYRIKTTEILDHVKSSIWLCDPEFRFLYLSGYFEDLYRMPRADIISDVGSWLENIVDDDRQSVVDILQDYADKRQSEVSFRYTWPDGSIRWILTRLIPILDSAGDLVRVVGIDTDITDERRALETARESERLALEVLDHSINSVVVIDAGGEVMYANETAAQTFEWPVGEMTGLTLDDLFNVGSGDIVGFSGSDRAVATGEYPGRRKGGGLFPCRVRVAALSDGADGRRIVFVEDLSQIYHLTEQLAEATRDDPVEIITEDPGMIGQLNRASVIARENVSVVLYGESGTGKELLANFIHRHHSNPRRKAPFIAVNCNTFSDQLLESELFGHRKGAFTGAEEDKQGILGRVEGGTLFLDEISDLSLAVQGKLLRVLENGEYFVLGDPEPTRCDFRLIAACNRDLRHEVEEGRFRNDLYHRIRVIEIPIPPLRERENDVLLLAHHFISRFNREYMKSKSLSPGAGDALARHDWKGNVRELRNVINEAVLFSETDRIATGDLAVDVDETVEVAGGRGSRQEVPAGVDYSAGFREAKQKAVDAFEAAYIDHILTRSGGNVSRAARNAGMSRKSLIDKMDRLEISARSYGR